MFLILRSVLSLLLLVLPACGLTINVAYDASVTNSAFFTNVQSDMAIATRAFTVIFTNSATLSLTCYWGNAGPFSGGFDLGSSSTVATGPYTYAQVTNALNNARSSTNDYSSVASLPAANPGATNLWWVPYVEAKLLNMRTNSGGYLTFLNPNDSVNGGSVGFHGTDSVPAINIVYAFNPTNRAVPGAYDFIGVAEHEISEVMGRSYGLNYGNEGYLPNDLFRFSAPGVRSLDYSDTNAYFSVNNGLTELEPFFPYFGEGDVQDWNPGAAPDSFDESAGSGKIYPLSPADIIAMDVLGYNLTAIPVPRLAGSRLSNGAFLLTFTNLSGAPFSVFYTTNLTLNFTNWTYLGPPYEVATGQFQFIDPTTNSRRFYRVRFP